MTIRVNIVPVNRWMLCMLDGASGDFKPVYLPVVAMATWVEEFGERSPVDNGHHVYFKFLTPEDLGAGYTVDMVSSEFKADPIWDPKTPTESGFYFCLDHMSAKAAFQYMMDQIEKEENNG